MISFAATRLSHGYLKGLLRSQLSFTKLAADQAPFSNLNMGRNKYRSQKTGNRQKPKQDVYQQDNSSEGKKGYIMTPRENADFEKYYKVQGLVPEGEWEDFMAILKTPLPSVFRITGYKSHSKELLRIIKSDYFDNLFDVEIEGRTISPPRCLPWYPDDMAWQLDLDRRFIRQHEVLKKLHRFLIQETESGAISRQEAVSMIPPLLMDIKPHHKVLDMCAAPGSKTAQLLEALHNTDDTVPEGFVVANDADNKRCYLMVHQVRRLETPNFVIINQDAKCLPNIHIRKEDGTKENLKFDRILADVPCSGDGTLRKNVDVWKKWNTGASHNLHHLQKCIVKRGLEMLAVGGRIVYSTCSFNPIENEAVIANLIKETEGAMKIVDASHLLPGLRITPGLTAWKVMSRQGEVYESYEELPASLLSQIRPSMFPPPLEEAQTMQLNKCIRLLPHHQNTGGFFIAVLEKVRQVPWMKEEQENVPAPRIPEKVTDSSAGGDTADSDDITATEAAEAAAPAEVDSSGKRKMDQYDRPPSKTKKMKMGYKEDPFLFLDKNEAILKGICEFYDLKEDFPVDQLMVRCMEGKKRNIYFTSKAIRNILQLNEDRIKFVNLGLKLLSRSPSEYCKCDYRLVQEGIWVLFPYIQKRIVHISTEDAIVLLVQENPFVSRFSKATQEVLEPMDQGSLTYVYEPQEGVDGPQCKLIISGWKGKTSTRSFLALNDRGHVLRLFGRELKSRQEMALEKEENQRARDARDAARNAGTLSGAVEVGMLDDITVIKSEDSVEGDKMERDETETVKDEEALNQKDEGGFQEDAPVIKGEEAGEEQSEKEGVHIDGEVQDEISKTKVEGGKVNLNCEVVLNSNSKDAE